MEEVPLSMSQSDPADFPAIAIATEAPSGVLVKRPAARSEIAAWILAGFALFVVIPLHLLPSLLAGLLVYEMVHVMARWFQSRPTSARGRVLAVMALATVIIGVLTGGILLAISFFRSEAGSFPALMKRLADILETSRSTIPPWILEYLPTEAGEMRAALTGLARRHSPELQLAGKSVGLTFAHILVGMVVGGIISLREAVPAQTQRPLARALLERASRFGDAFRSVVFAQIRISALNTVFTALYLLAVLPLFGIHLPLTKTMICVTFFAGLIPVVGNLISNTVIVIVSLSHSPQIAIVSLGFLVVIHKLEYFLNAQIIGSQIHASSWELLLAMLVMESAFGLPGVIAAPIYYAYLKQELADRGLV